MSKKRGRSRPAAIDIDSELPSSFRNCASFLRWLAASAKGKTTQYVCLGHHVVASEVKAVLVDNANSAPDWALRVLELPATKKKLRDEFFSVLEMLFTLVQLHSHGSLRTLVVTRLGIWRSLDDRLLERPKSAFVEIPEEEAERLIGKEELGYMIGGAIFFGITSRTFYKYD